MHDDDDDGSDGNKMDFKTIFPNNGRRQKQPEQTPQRISRRKRKRRPGLITREPTPTFQYDDGSRPSASQQKTRIKSLIFADLDISIDKLQRTLESEGITMSRIGLSDIKRAFKEDLKFLTAMGRFTPDPK